jgi:hypothetical protein
MKKDYLLYFRIVAYVDAKYAFRGFQLTEVWKLRIPLLPFPPDLQIHTVFYV